MKGEIALINLKRGMAAVITEDEEYTSFENLGGFGIDIGDIIIGDLESLGGETWFNQTKTEKFDVSVEDIHGSKKNALSIIS